MLAKIAHSFAWAALGEGSFEPSLPEFILNGPDLHSYYIGNDEAMAGDERRVWRVYLAEIEAADGTPFLCAGIRLFCFAGTPPYLVVVGKRVGEKFSLLKNRVFAIADDTLQAGG
ncbi:MAG TPA: hypothetical protein VKE94_10630 [Gemmataceae bacterium]|nr:hypothetical protein [Gemmataceae bacterium]